MPSKSLSCARNVPTMAVSSGMTVTASSSRAFSQISDGGLIKTTPPHLDILIAYNILIKNNYKYIDKNIIY